MTAEGEDRITPEEEERLIREHDERMEREKADRSRFAFYVFVGAALFMIVFLAIFFLFIKPFT